MIDKKAVGLAVLLAVLALPVHAAAPADAVPPMVPVKRRPSDATYKDYPARTVDSLPGFLPDAPAPPLDKYGGRTDRKLKATGFFRVEKQGDRWWLVDPEGALFINVGVVALNPRHTPGFSAKFASDADWANQTGAMLRREGFNGAGGWSDVDDIRNAADPMVYTVIGNSGAKNAPDNGGFMQTFGKKQKIAKSGTGHYDYVMDCIPVFHPAFEAFCDTYAAPMAAMKDDPHLLGYFSDNELPLPMLKKYLALPPDDPGMGSSYQAARAWWDARKGKDATISDITDADQEAWAEYVFGRYFEITTKAIRKYDPNHLCLGSRINFGARAPGAYRAAGKYLDVVAINLYFVWDPVKQARQISEWAGKPIMITEFYAKGMDSGFANTSGAGWTVPTQKDRGLFYQTFILGLLQSKDCVGWHWFKYSDNDPNDKKADPSNRDSNKGIINNRFELYTPFVDQMSTVNHAVYALTDYFDRLGGAPAP